MIAVYGLERPAVASDRASPVTTRAVVPAPSATAPRSSTRPPSSTTTGAGAASMSRPASAGDGLAERQHRRRPVLDGRRSRRTALTTLFRGPPPAPEVMALGEPAAPHQATGPCLRTSTGPRRPAR